MTDYFKLSLHHLFHPLIMNAKRTYFTITSVSNDISNLNACICSHNAVDSWDVFPPLLGFGHKSRGNIHWFLRECTFPLMQSCFCRKQGFLPSLYLGVQGTLRKRDESRFYNARLVSAQIPAGLNDSLAGARHCLYQFQWLSQRPGRL